MPAAERKALVDAADEQLSIARQCRLLGLNRSYYYYKPKGMSQADLELMKRMDRMYSEDPTRGTRRYKRDLALAGYGVSRDKVRRLMQVMRLKPIYCKPRTTVIDPGAYKYPYLLRELSVERANQVWAVDISYIPMERGFMYLVAVIDVYSRFIVGWDISNSMSSEWVVRVLEKAVDRYGAPGIINSDQGTQFCSDRYIDYLKGLDGVRISMDGKGRATDNAFIERFFRTIKYEKIYLHLPEDGEELYSLCKEFISFYNRERGHSSIDGLPPSRWYEQAA